MNMVTRSGTLNVNYGSNSHYPEARKQCKRYNDYKKKLISKSQTKMFLNGSN